MLSLAMQAPMNADAKYYIYTGWPGGTAGYQAKWDQTVPDDNSTTTRGSRQYVDHLLGRIRGDRPTMADQLFVVDVGEVLYRLDQEMIAGNFPEPEPDPDPETTAFDSVYDIYRDSIHLSWKIGRFTAGTVMYATIFQTNPTGVPEPSGFYDIYVDENVTDAMRLFIQNITWETITANPTRTGVFAPGDLNGDGAVNISDVSPFILALTNPAAYDAAYPLVLEELAGDIDYSGALDLGDLRSFSAMFEPSAATALSVPEPSVLFLTILAIITLVVHGSFCRNRKAVSAHCSG